MEVHAASDASSDVETIDDVRAYGPRLAYEALPSELRNWVNQELGSPVLEAATQMGGFSPGVAARLRCADGSRAFVKAVGTALNPDSPQLIRTEVGVLEALGPSVLRPALLASYDDGDWAAILLEDIEGHLPALPWRTKDLARVLDALDVLAATHTPCPWPGAPPLASQLPRLLNGWATLQAATPDDLSPWARAHLDELAALAAETMITASKGDTCIHLDMRSDNILLTPDRVVFVDWNWCAVGPEWFDTVCLALEVWVTGGDAEQLLAACPRTRDVDPLVITGVIAGLAGMFEERRRAPPPPGLPRIRGVQARYAAALAAWTRERTGWR